MNTNEEMIRTAVFHLEHFGTVIDASKDLILSYHQRRMTILTDLANPRDAVSVLGAFPFGDLMRVRSKVQYEGFAFEQMCVEWNLLVSERASHGIPRRRRTA